MARFNDLAESWEDLYVEGFRGVQSGPQVPGSGVGSSGASERCRLALGGVADEPPALSEELVQAWMANRTCLHCGRPVASADEAALLVGPNRVTHRARCFIPALIRSNPLLKLLTARDGAEEVATSPARRNGTGDAHDGPQNGGEAR